ncbi:MAG: glycerol-3-phosphate dehydrogenase/oxidase [Verrucomicrobiae bacterium]|nr:glycerol-3-phosphate dehydrogenase/oxidase [Verrucomicrobiae bacterium]
MADPIHSSVTFSNRNRKSFADRLRSEVFDLLVIGGGITGCGIALDAALRGMKVALVEKDDFASGTSSRSTKLIHGGLRYLKQFDLRLVREVGRERAVVHRNARHLVLPEKMLLPLLRNGSLGRRSCSLGLRVYDFLAGVERPERRVMLDRQATLAAEPLLDKSRLLGGALYYEYRTDDSRLTIEIAKSAHVEGAVLLNYVEALSFRRDSPGQITGIEAHDVLANRQLRIRARIVVNAAGPWVDALRKKDDDAAPRRLQLTKGVHLAFPYARLPLRQALYFDGEGGRMIFAIPRLPVTYVGTTDTLHHESPDAPRCDREDADSLLRAANAMFPSLKLRREEAVSSWAGLRPLILEEGKAASELSRRDEIMRSPSGLLSIAGGKLTGYRRMAERIVDLVAKRLGGAWRDCRTCDHRLSGGDFKSEETFQAALQHFMEEGSRLQLPRDRIREWFFRYGTNTSVLLAHLRDRSPSLPCAEETLNDIELSYTLDHEMVAHPGDFLIRRTGDMLFERARAEKRIESATRSIAEELDLPSSVAARQLSEIRAEFHAALDFL